MVFFTLSLLIISNKIERKYKLFNVKTTLKIDFPSPTESIDSHIIHL